MKDVIDKIKWLLNNYGATEIARNTGLSQQSIYKYMKKTNPSKIENMTLETAEKLYNYAVLLHKNTPAD